MLPHETRNDVESRQSQRIATLEASLAAVTADRDRMVEALRKAEIGLANAASFKGKALGDVEQRSVERRLQAIRAALTNTSASPRG